MKDLGNVSVGFKKYPPERPLDLADDVSDPIEGHNKVDHTLSEFPEECFQEDVILGFTGITPCSPVGSVFAQGISLNPVWASVVRYISGSNVNCGTL
jgi:hypothetical protein